MSNDGIVIRCGSCSAPADPRTGICSYCGAKNDIDLQGRVDLRKEGPSDRMCPICSQQLMTISLELGDGFFVERCEKCKGLFFDPGELLMILEKAASRADEVCFESLKQVTEGNDLIRRDVRYVKCPVCQTFMLRVNFGRRSGVVVDKCKKHGVWLCAGELKQLLLWKQAGGDILDARSQLKEQKDINRWQAERRKLYAEKLTADASVGSAQWNTVRSFSNAKDSSLVDGLVRLVFDVFD